MPSEKSLEKKRAYVEELAGKIKSANVGVVVSFEGISSKDATSLRKEMREAEVDYFVVKNTMLRLASNQVGFDFSDSLIGTTAIALSKDDPINISKILTNYAKKLADTTKFKIKKGFIDGEIVDAETINKYGSLPTKDQLIGQLLFLLTAPIKKLAVGLNEVAKKNSTENS